MAYVFLSFASPHTGKNLGVCIVQVDNPGDANDRAKELGLMPDECNHCRGFLLTDEGFEEQGLELNRFYTADEMRKLGFTSSKHRI